MAVNSSLVPCPHEIADFKHRFEAEHPDIAQNPHGLLAYIVKISHQLEVIADSNDMVAFENLFGVFRIAKRYFEETFGHLFEKTEPTPAV